MVLVAEFEGPGPHQYLLRDRSPKLFVCRHPASAILRVLVLLHPGRARRKPRRLPHYRQGRLAHCAGLGKGEGGEGSEESRHRMRHGRGSGTREGSHRSGTGRCQRFRRRGVGPRRGQRRPRGCRPVAQGWPPQAEAGKESHLGRRRAPRHLCHRRDDPADCGILPGVVVLPLGGLAQGVPRRLDSEVGPHEHVLVLGREHSSDAPLPVGLDSAPPPLGPLEPHCPRYVGIHGHRAPLAAAGLPEPPQRLHLPRLQCAPAADLPRPGNRGAGGAGVRHRSGRGRRRGLACCGPGARVDATAHVLEAGGARRFRLGALCHDVRRGRVAGGAGRGVAGGAVDVVCSDFRWCDA
mmetsp:Transcript_71018/g.230570  ORF Transcript_71018/g.230570 Transcript_71018/m.230570 type:complete len:351 (+) Transcript_71018:5067-6119(+)